MKVSNSKVGGAGGKLDSIKNAKADGAQAVNKDGKVGSLDAKSVKDSANVAVSDRAQMMKKAKDIASGEPQVDEARVVRLQKMIDEGKYNVDADKIADRLVDQHLMIPDEP